MESNEHPLYDFWKAMVSLDKQEKTYMEELNQKAEAELKMAKPALREEAVRQFAADEQTRLDDVNIQYTQLLAELETQHRQELKKLESQRTARLKEFNDAGLSPEQLKQATALLNASVDQLKQELEEAVADSRQLLAEQVKVTKEKLSKVYAAVRSNPGSDWNKGVDKAISATLEEYQRQLTETEKEAEKQFAKARTDYVGAAKNGIGESFSELRKQFELAEEQVAQAERDLKKQDWKDRLPVLPKPKDLISAKLSGITMAALNLNTEHIPLVSNLMLPTLTLPAVPPFKLPVIRESLTLPRLELPRF